MSEIKTLVELFDESQIENVIASLRYKPEKLIFVGYENIMSKRRRTAVERFFRLRGLDIQIDYKYVAGNNYACIVDMLNTIADDNEGCYFDVTGGKELVLVAMGAVAVTRNIPMIKFYIRTGKYIQIYGDGDLPYTDIPVLTIEEIVALNGGAVIRNDSDNHAWEWNDEFISDLESIWSISKKNCSLWNRQSQMFASFEKHGQIDSDFSVCTDITYLDDIIKDDYLNSSILSQLTEQGLIRDFCVRENIVTYKYKNEQVRRCLMKCGSILELYTFSLLNEIRKNDSGYYDDIDTGVYVDWDGNLHAGIQAYDTINEVDIIVMRDAVPVFISCKNGDVKKEALYELDTVANRFGGAYVKKVLLTTHISADSNSRKYLHQRARDMNIDVIDNVDKMSRNKLIMTLKKRIK